MKRLLRLKMMFFSVFLFGLFAFSLNSQTVVNNYSQNFEGDVDTAFWAYNWAAAGLIKGDRDGGTFKYETTELNNYFLGVILQFVNKGTLISLKEYPYISFDAKAVNCTLNSTSADSIPIGIDLINKAGSNIGLFYTKAMISTDGSFQTCKFDFSSLVGNVDMDSVAKIRFNPGKDRFDQYAFFSGTVWIDNFKAGMSASPPELATSYNQPFTDPFNESLWLPNTLALNDSTQVFTVEQVNGTLHYMENQKNFYDGQYFNFLKNENVMFDITENPYFKVKLKVMPGATYSGDTIDSVPFLVSPWGKDSTGVAVRMVDSPLYYVPADGQWHEYIYDFGAKAGVPMWNGVIPPADFSAIEAVLMENVIYPGTYKFEFYMDDFRLGEAAAPPTVLTSYNQPFTDPFNESLWLPNTLALNDSTQVFTVEQVDGTLHYMENQKNFYDGQYFNFLKNENVMFDITENPYFKVKLKVMPGATYSGDTIDSVPFLVSPWGKDSTGVAVRMVDSPLYYVPADGQWHEYIYDFGAKAGVPMWNGVIPPADFSAIEAVLMENVIYPGTYKFEFYMDDFRLGEAAAPPTVLTSYNQPFTDPFNESLWLPNTLALNDSTQVFTVEQVDGTLYYTENQKNFYDGQYFNFLKNENVMFDITENPYFKVKLKVMPGATYSGDTIDSVPFLVSPWGKDSTGVAVRMVDSPLYYVPADGQWHEYIYDFGAKAGVPMWNGVIPPADFSAIEAILMENVIYPGTYKFEFYMDDFRLGEVAALPTLLTSYNQPFTDPFNESLWLPNTLALDDSTQVFTVEQVDGTLHYMENQKNFYDGQYFNFLKNENVMFDITENPYFKVKLKVMPGATYSGDTIDSVPFLVSPWGKDSTGVAVRMVDSPLYYVPADGEWHEYTFDFGAKAGVPMWNGVIPPADFSAIEAVLMENVIYPGTYKFEFYMDDFRLGDAAGPINHSTVLPYSDGKFWAQIQVTPSDSNMDAVVGLSKSPITGLGDFVTVCRFNSDGHIDVLNGNAYTSDISFPYTAGKTYIVEFIGDVKTKLYAVNVESAELGKYNIASNLSFADGVVADTLKYINSLVNDDAGNGGITGSYLKSDFANDVYVWGWNNIQKEDMVLTQNPNVKVTLTPSDNFINAGLGFSETNPGLLTWGDLSGIIRFNLTGYIDAYNKNTYSFENQIFYEGGKSYMFDIDFNIPNLTYNISVTPEGGSKKVIGTEYGFRKAADTLNFITKLQLIGGAFGGVIGDLAVSDIVVTPVGVNSTEIVHFSAFPNPTVSELNVISEENFDKITVYDLFGKKCLESTNTDKNNTRINVSSLVNGVYIVSIHTSKGISAKTFVKN